MIAFVDLDGVLCDSIGEMFRRFGRGKEPKDCRGSYDTSTILGIRDPWSQFGSDFFADVGWTNDGRQLFEAVTGLVGRDHVCICSSPTYESSSAEGKLRWIRRKLGHDYERQYVLTPNKWLLAGPDRVLIDDCDAEICKFRSWGGSGILVPRPWNSLYESCDGDVVSHVAHELGKWFRLRKAG